MRFVVDVVQPKLFFHGHYHTYSDRVFTLSTAEGEQYMSRMVCLDMNGVDNNITVLTPSTMSYEIIS